MSEREPFRPDFDAVVDFYPPQRMPEMVYGLLKRTYEIVNDRLVPCEVIPLNHDIRDPDTPAPLAPGSDFWPMKGGTDVIVRGSACAPGGKPVRSQMIRVTVGKDQKPIAVYGDRVVEWVGPGQVRFSEPEPFTEIPVEWKRAYGGADLRVPVDMEPTLGNLSRLELDHPGLYPRNPLGRGYCVVDEPAEGVLLPNLEDPNQLLRPETYITRDPQLWHRQPLPACYEHTNYGMFSRYAWLGLEAWYQPPQDTPLREVELGYLPANWHELPTIVMAHSPLPPLALQEGPMGMVYPTLEPGTPVIAEGMHPELAYVGFPIPPLPKLSFFIDGKIYEAAEIQLQNVLLMPNEAKVSLTYVARNWDMPRPFVPGIHRNIPLALVVDGKHTVPYECPPSVREQVAAGDKGRPGKPKPKT